MVLYRPRAKPRTSKPEPKLAVDAGTLTLILRFSLIEGYVTESCAKIKAMGLEDKGGIGFSGRVS